MAGSSRPGASLRALDAHFRSAVGALRPAQVAKPAGAGPGLTTADLEMIFDAQAASRHIDLVARELQAVGEGFYTIGSAGHESNAAVAHALAVTDPALLHYRSGGFYLDRAARRGLDSGVRDILQGVMALADEPMAGGRHKVFGRVELDVIPQTSTVASHLPRAVGLAITLSRAYRLARRHPGMTAPSWPEDAVVVCSFGDAAVNHSTAAGAINTALNTAYRGLPVPVLFVCEDNGLGISVPTPAGWLEHSFGNRTGLDYLACDGRDTEQVYAVAAEAARRVRTGRRPALLHLHCVRYGGHAGSDAEIGYRSRARIEADRDRDPLLGTARALVARGVSPAEVLARYQAQRDRVHRERAALLGGRRLSSAAEVMTPLAEESPSPRSSRRVAQSVTSHHGAEASPTAAAAAVGDVAGGIPATLAESINAALDDLLGRDPRVLVFGEDVGVKGGVYGVTRGLARRHGTARVFDTVLDEQSILGLALGAGLAGLLPVPEVQYLAYLHNAIDQLRGEAATQRFFSAGRYRNPMVLRLPGLAYQKGFGGHFHNDNAVAALRDVPGLVVGCPSRGDDAAAMLRSLMDAARVDGTVSVLLEPIALYHRRDLYVAGDGGWLSIDDGESAVIGTGRIRRHGEQLTMITFGNGVPMCLQAARRLAGAGIEATVLDLRWIVPLPITDILTAAGRTGRVLVVDETRHDGGVGEGVITALVENGFTGRIDRVAARNSFVPLGPAAELVLVDVTMIDEAATALLGIDHPTGAAPRRDQTCDRSGRT